MGSYHKVHTAFLSFQNADGSLSFSVPTEDIKLGVSVADWKESLRIGSNASSPYNRYSRLCTSRTGGSFIVTVKRKESPSKGRVLRAQASGFVQPNVVDVSSLMDVPQAVENAAKARFASKVKSFEQAWQSGSSIGELRKTIDGLRNPLKSLIRGVSGYVSLAGKRGKSAISYAYANKAGSNRSRRTRAGIALGDALTGTYLEFQFGMRPILFDMIDAQKAYDRVVARTHVDLDRISATERWERTVSSDRDVTGSGLPVLVYDDELGGIVLGRISTDRVVTVRGTLTYSGAIACDLINRSVRSQLGLMPADFLPTVWNLVPWSWALDTVSNVGDMLDCMSTSYGSLAWCNRALSVEADQVFQPGDFITVADDSPATWELLFKQSTGSYTIKTRNYARTPYVPSLENMIPSLMFRLPSLTGGLNLAAAIFQAKAVSHSLDQQLLYG
jgi:hypothetical protein